MKRTFFILILFSALISCSNSNDKENQVAEKNSIKATLPSDTMLPENKISFKNILEVVQHKTPGSWVYIKDSITSFALFFSALDSNMLGMKFSPECWIYFPYQYSSNEITVYWDTIIDTKYDFNIVKAINRIDRKFIGKPFMTLKLLNDSTLQPTYLFPEIIKQLNLSDKDRLLFPDRYSFSTTFSL